MRIEIETDRKCGTLRLKALNKTLLTLIGPILSKVARSNS